MGGRCEPIHPERAVQANPEATLVPEGASVAHRMGGPHPCFQALARHEPEPLLGHPVWVLTVSYPGGRTKQISLSAEQKVLLQEWLRNYRKRKDTLERICVLNRQLLRPENPA